ncbi:glycerol kinase [Kineosporia succinea]|uniref:Glycerol kinase n=1 Tax=Kineosporia succinea TaxID=84632 RepID=A0ABT9PBR4_9ACTN|nr:FGGY family carbohydrate kinase [Kineosporia succinea]MDP9830143.1 glycerol kinase [Kineosporia succinea]
MADIVVAVDQGTSSTKAVAVSVSGEVVADVTVPVGIAHPSPGRVEQDAEELVTSVVTALGRLGQLDGRVAAVGLSTQRESALVWERSTGKPLGPMLGWQDRRTAGRARALSGEAGRVRSVTGLPLDPMFSALKIGWLLDEIDPDRRRSRAGELAVGTVDSWLLARLTGEHRIELGNAARTQLLSLDAGDWDAGLLELFGIPEAVLPRLTASDEPTALVDGLGVPVTGVLGDSHAALYGHGIREAGSVKVTLGTGSSVMGLGDVVPGAMARTIAWAAPDVALAFEGNILSSGSTLVWLSHVLGLSTGELIALGLDSPDSPVDLVPAVAGLGAPWWDPGAQAIITGFDLGTGRSALARAAVDAVVLQIEDVLEAADTATGERVGTVHVDGGPAGNDRLVQHLADLTGRTVVRPAATGLSALGAASLAGARAGLWESLPGGATRTFGPTTTSTIVKARRDRWRGAVERARYQTVS